jgi:asparagine synthase (glutamine-hydrolysing)
MANKLCHANGIEVRCPFIAPELVEFMDSLPMDMKFDITQPKRFQKEMMAGTIPDYILFARKRGFSPPFEFIWQMCGKYQYKHIEANHCFYNSMVADRMIDNLLKK